MKPEEKQLLERWFGEFASLTEHQEQSPFLKAWKESEVKKKIAEILGATGGTLTSLAWMGAMSGALPLGPLILGPWAGLRALNAYDGALNALGGIEKGKPIRNSLKRFAALGNSLTLGGVGTQINIAKEYFGYVKNFPGIAKILGLPLGMIAGNVKSGVESLNRVIQFFIGENSLVGKIATWGAKQEMKGEDFFGIKPLNHLFGVFDKVHKMSQRFANPQTAPA